MPRVIATSGNVRVVRMVCRYGKVSHRSVAEGRTIDAMGQASWIQMSVYSSTDSDSDKLKKQFQLEELLNMISSMVPIDDTDDKPEKVADVPRETGESP